MSGTTTSPVCVDAGILVRLLTGQDQETIRPLWKRWRNERRTLIAPLLLRYEVTNALHRLRAASAISEGIAVASRFRLPAAYDAHDHYLALSGREGADFRTTDRRLSHAVRHALPWVFLVGAGTASNP